MLLQELYNHFGTYTKMVRELDLGNSTYLVWRKQGYIPFKAQLLIERQTDGLFKACESHGKPKKKRAHG